MQRRPAIPKRAIFFAVALVGLIVLIAGMRFYTDVLWFREVRLTSVLWKSIRVQFAVGAVVGSITAFLVWLNLALVARLAPTYTPPSVEVIGRSGRPDPLVQYREALRPFLTWIRLGIAVFLGISAGVAAGAAWQSFLLFANRVDFGVTDPQFGRDIGFYVFQLPFFSQITDWLWFAVMASLLTAAAAHYLYGAIKPELGLRGITSGALAHLSVLLGVLALIKAVQYWLGTFQLNFSERGTVTGASYTDINAQLPALRLLAIISVISAILFIVNIGVRKLSLPLAAVSIWVLTAFLAGAIWPLVVQRFSVEPQEPQRERPYIERNLEATRDAFGLSDVEQIDYAASTTLNDEQVETNQGMLSNVRLWDPGVLQSAYSQLQAVTQYYQFLDVDVDRYEVDGEVRQVMMAPRELELDDLPPRSRTWQNEHLQYTHGFGIVASLSNSSTTAGQPEFLVGGIPGEVEEGAESLNVEQPRIYYGEGFSSAEYSVVDTEQEELDFPLEGGVERISYEGAGGIEIGGIFRRLAFALREGDPNLVLSGLITGDSQILIYRNVRDRVSRAAPFLQLDNDPYAAVVDGRLLWIVDAYTTTQWYPYSERFDAGEVIDQTESNTLDGDINYVRNSVKIVVDAYDGTMDFYVVDETDPLIQTWRNVFPELFTDEEPSDDLQAHFRYPEDLFTLQADVYRTYHMTDPLDFYSKEDEWTVPVTPTVGDFETTGNARTPVTPTYLLYQPPGQDEQRFVLTLPFVRRNRPNMISLMIASSDPGSYGEKQSLMFPRSRVVPGPQQVDNLINQDVEISRILTLLSQRGSTVSFGSLVILPIDESVLYIQPLFITASNVGIPELKKVTAVIGERVFMGDTFEEALTGVLGLDAPIEDPDAEPTPEPSPTDDGQPPEVDAELQELIERAGRIYEQAQRALADGDFARYGELIERLGRVISQAQDLAPSGR